MRKTCHAARLQTLYQRRLQLGARQPPVIPDRDRLSAGARHDRAEHTADGECVRRMQRTPHDASNVVFAQDRRIEMMRECHPVLPDQQYSFRKLAHRRLHVRPLEREGDLRLEEADLIAAIEAPPFVAKPVERQLADHPGHAIGQLHLVARTTLHEREMLDHLRQQHVAADHRQVRRRILRRGFLDQAGHLDEPAVVAANLQYTVAIGLLPGHLRHSKDVPPGLIIGFGELLQAGLVGEHQIIGSRTANGSSPMKARAHQIACPRPSGTC